MLGALDERRAEREVGEDQHEAREHEREHREAVLLRNQQARDDDRACRADHLERDLRGAGPAEAARDAAAQSAGRCRRASVIDHDGTGGCASAPGRSARVAAGPRDYGARMAISPTARLRDLASDSSASSLSHRLRERRFALFERLVGHHAAPALDHRPRRDERVLGGARLGGPRRHLDHAREPRGAAAAPRQRPPERRRRDATSSDHADSAFDIAFSNSVIEHLFTFESQAAMAREVQRVASRLLGADAELLVPDRAALPGPGLALAAGGRAGRDPAAAAASAGPAAARIPSFARRIVREIRLMRRGELEALFPGAAIVGERFGGLVKSWTVIGGFPAAPASRLVGEAPAPSRRSKRLAQAFAATNARRAGLRRRPAPAARAATAGRRSPPAGASSTGPSTAAIGGRSTAATGRPPARYSNSFSGLIASVSGLRTCGTRHDVGRRRSAGRSRRAGGCGADLDVRRAAPAGEVRRRSSIGPTSVSEPSGIRLARRRAPGRRRRATRGCRRRAAAGAASAANQSGGVPRSRHSAGSMPFGTTACGPVGAICASAASGHRDDAAAAGAQPRERRRIRGPPAPVRDRGGPVVPCVVGDRARPVEAPEPGEGGVGGDDRGPLEAVPAGGAPQAALVARRLVRRRSVGSERRSRSGWWTCTPARAAGAG